MHCSSSPKNTAPPSSNLHSLFISHLSFLSPLTVSLIHSQSIQTLVLGPILYGPPPKPHADAIMLV